MLLLGPEKGEAICLEVVLAFAATEIPFICCQIAAPRIFAEPAFKCIWHEVHLRVPIPLFYVQRRIVEVYARQIPHMQGRRLWLLVGNFVICSFRGAVGQTSPLIFNVFRFWFCNTAAELAFGNTCAINDEVSLHSITNNIN
jgi:hypothetical protein